MSNKRLQRLRRKIAERERRKMLQNMGAGQDSLPSVVGMAAASSYSGPIPPPAMMREFDAVVPGSAERILKMAEDQSAHRIDMEKRVTKGDDYRAWAGLACAFVLSAGVIGVGGYAVHLNHPLSGASLIGGTLAALAGVFIHGTNSRRRERRERLDAMTGRRK